MSNYLFKSLSGATAAGPGTALMFDSPRHFGLVSLQTIFTGLPSFVQVSLEGTLDGTTWGALFATNPSNSGDIVQNNMPPVMGVRINLVTLTGGTSPIVDAWFAACPLDN